MNATATTFEVREITDIRAQPSPMASFPSMTAAVSWLNETFEVLCGEEFDGAFDGIVRPKGKPFMIPMQVSITRGCSACKTEGFQYTCEDCMPVGAGSPSIEVMWCRHEPFEGRCVHCNVPFVDGQPALSKADKTAS